MKKVFLALLVFGLLVPSLEARPLKKKKAAAPPPPPAAAPAAPPTVTTASKPSEIFDVVGELNYKMKLHSYLGWGSLAGNGSGYMVGAQLGLPLSAGSRFYLGPEIDFALLSPGSLVNTLLAGWYEFRLGDRSPWTLSFGGAGGVGFAQDAPELGRVSWAAYVSSTISREIDDLASLRGQVKPGLIEGHVSILVNLGVEFRFL